MKYLILFAFFVCVSLQAQVTTSITVEGQIAKPFTVKFDDLKSYKSQSIDSVTIWNHKMERKSSLKGIKGVLLKDVLEKAEFSVNSPKFLSEFYIVCIADDGYKVVFSWNEIFNSETGNKALIVTEIGGKPTISQKEGLILITPTDKATGRRYVKNFSKILIQKVP
ncbi:MAG: molybdopterin-binding protein [Flavobacterium sp.]|uniref:molybdopterin-binding protein n=1 Tax=Flavobacterium sp. TaxID=239 RepID=UPI00121EE2FB|nr:molybdopterin-binding protein [Flavobacterium sp.]RZJ64264.1 MAG: molybdopterin-binding protein [Flavobacterium sp.]